MRVAATVLLAFMLLTSLPASSSEGRERLVSATDAEHDEDAAGLGLACASAAADLVAGYVERDGESVWLGLRVRALEPTTARCAGDLDDRPTQIRYAIGLQEPGDGLPAFACFFVLPRDELAGCGFPGGGEPHGLEIDGNDVRVYLDRAPPQLRAEYMLVAFAEENSGALAAPRDDLASSDRFWFERPPGTLAWSTDPANDEDDLLTDTPCASAAGVDLVGLGASLEGEVLALHAQLLDAAATQADCEGVGALDVDREIAYSLREPTTGDGMLRCVAALPATGEPTLACDAANELGVRWDVAGSIAIEGDDVVARVPLSEARMLDDHRSASFNATGRAVLLDVSTFANEAATDAPMLLPSDGARTGVFVPGPAPEARIALDALGDVATSLGSCAAPGIDILGAGVQVGAWSPDDRYLDLRLDVADLAVAGVACEDSRPLLGAQTDVRRFGLEVDGPEGPIARLRWTIGDEYAAECESLDARVGCDHLWAVPDRTGFGAYLWPLYGSDGRPGPLPPGPYTLRAESSSGRLLEGLVNDLLAPAELAVQGDRARDSFATTVG